MGMMDWMDGESGEDSDTVATDGLGFDEDLDDFDDEMGDLDGGMDDFGDEGFDGEMDGLDGEMDGFDGGGDFGGSDIDPSKIADLEDRISELETEVSGVSSEMNTVREENKQIGGTVEELDETVRKLLDIYEMVTRGINPFVDDAREMGGLEGDGAFGLFEMEEETEDDLDTNVASADAESFFDEDFGDLDADADEAELAAQDELADEEREDPGEAIDDDTGGETSGTSFDDLKEEYEENEGWDDVGGEADADAAELIEEGAADDATEDAEADDSGVGGGDDVFDDGSDFDDALDAADEATDVDSEESAFEQAEVVPSEDAAGADPTVDPDDAERADGTTGSTEPVAASTSTADGSARRTTAAAEDVYLASLPARYTAESVVLQWATFLVETGGAIGAARALRQYRSQGWIARDVERTMSEHVRNAATAGTTEHPQDLRIDHHRESLTYISRLAEDVDESRLLEELSALGGGARGIRR